MPENSYMLYVDKNGERLVDGDRVMFSSNVWKVMSTNPDGAISIMPEDADDFYEDVVSPADVEKILSPFELSERKRAKYTKKRLSHKEHIAKIRKIITPYDPKT